MRGGGGGAGPAFGPAPFLLGGVGAAKGLLPCFLVPKRNQPTACTLALWWLKFGPTELRGGGGGAIKAVSTTALVLPGECTWSPFQERMLHSWIGGLVAHPLGWVKRAGDL